MKNTESTVPCPKCKKVNGLVYEVDVADDYYKTVCRSCSHMYLSDRDGKPILPEERLEDEKESKSSNT